MFMFTSLMTITDCDFRLCICGFRVGLPEEAISTSGVWDAAQRKLTLDILNNRVWAFHNTNSEKGLLRPLFYLPSGAAHYSGITATVPSLEIYFNEVGLNCA